MLKKGYFSDWATPDMVVPKKVGRVRLCRDYKVTNNPVIDLSKYSLPCLEDFFATLPGGKIFTVLDLSNAYQQLSLDEKSWDLFTISTH